MEGNSTLLIAIALGVVIALLAVALFLLSRKKDKPAAGAALEPLVKRNPDYGPRSTEASTATEAATPAKEKAAESGISLSEAPAAKVEEAKAPEPKEPEAPKKAEPKPQPAVDEGEDEWGDDDAWDVEMSGDIDQVGVSSVEDDFSAEVKAQQETAQTPKKSKSKLVDRRSSEEDEDEWGDDIDSMEELDDGWAGPVLKRVSPEVKEAFKESSLNQEFHVSKRKEADDLIVKCVQAYLAGEQSPEVKAARERVFALHAKIQLSDLPEIVESFVDSGDDSNQAHFADFEDMCNTHEDSVLVLFEKFNTTLPPNLRSRRIAELTEPMAAVVYLAPEWEDDDFDRPDFDERDEDVDENVDYLEDFYDQLDDDDEEEATTDSDSKKEA